MLNAGARKQGLRSNGANNAETIDHRDGVITAADSPQADARANHWGWLPELTMLSSSAVLLFAMTTPGAYTVAPWATPLFWLGLLLIFVPGVMRLCSHEPSRFERIGILVMLVAAFYILKLLHSPFAFTFADELVHSYNADAILQNHHLFTPNSIIRASAFYPGLEIVAAWLVTATGTPLFVAAAMLIGAARLILVLALFLLFEQISRSPRVASLGAVIFMGQPNFLFWSAQFSYESLSLPMAIALLVIAGKRSALLEGPLRRAYSVLFFLGAAALVTIHHLTVFALVAVLAAWSVVEWLQIHVRLTQLIERQRQRFRRHGGFRRFVDWLGDPAGEQLPMLPSHATRGRGLAVLAALTLLAELTWLFLVASPTIAYLSPVLTRAVLSIVQLLAGEQGGRQLFAAANGNVAPLLERVIGIGSVLLSLVGLPLGLRQVWRRCGANALAFVLALAAIFYFAVLPLKLTNAGWETGNRASAYLFVGLAFVLALAVDGITPRQRTLTPTGADAVRRSARWEMRLAAGCITVLFLGGVILGWIPQLRLAQPLVVATKDATLFPQSWAVADWARTELPPGQVFGADEINGRVLLAQGKQFVLTGRHPSISELLRELEMKDWHLEALQRQKIRYLVVDKRRISWDNMAGYFFDRAENGRLPPDALFDEEQTSKYDRQPVDRILDTGNIVIYDVKGLHNAPTAR